MKISLPLIFLRWSKHSNSCFEVRCLLVLEILLSYIWFNPLLMLPGTHSRCLSSPTSFVPDQSPEDVQAADLQCCCLVIIRFPPVPQGHGLFFPLHVETGLVEGPGYQALSKHGQGQSVFSTVLFVQLWVITQALKSQHSFGSLAAL